MKVQLNVNGFEYEAYFTEREFDYIVKPLIVKFQKMRDECGRRVVVFLAAPPAVGKSTFAVFLEKVSREMEGVYPVQSLSLDGFHYSNEYLKRHKAFIDGEERYLSEVKGMPETFNREAFRQKLTKLKHENVKWPIYDRNLHDVVEEQILIDSEIVLIEGNWLLLDEDGWRELYKLSDFSIFINANENMLKDRLINRKIKGGMDPDDAGKFYENSDRKNIKRALEHHLEPDLILEMLDSGERIVLKEDLEWKDQKEQKFRRLVDF